MREEENRQKDITDEVAQDHLDGNQGGGSNHPYVSIDDEDDGSRGPLITIIVVAVIAITVIVVVLSMKLL